MLYAPTVFVGAVVVSSVSYSSIADTANPILKVYPMPALAGQYLDSKGYPYHIVDTTYPLPISENYSLSMSVTPGEFEPATFVMRSEETLTGVRITASALTLKAVDGTTKSIPADRIDIRLVKTWFQLNDSYVDQTRPGGYLIPELLVKDDSLIQTNLNNKTSKLHATGAGCPNDLCDITSPDSKVPDGVTIRDAVVLQSFIIPKNTNKQAWVTVHPATDTPAGTYIGTLTVSAMAPRSSPTNTVITFAVTVLPFSLAPPLVEQAIFYRGWEQKTCARIDSECKTCAQLRADMQNMYDHGISYPNFYTKMLWDRDPIRIPSLCAKSKTRIEHRLDLMGALGFPQDKIYVAGEGDNPSPEYMPGRVALWKATASERGWAECQHNPLTKACTSGGDYGIYFMGVDEAGSASSDYPFARQADTWKAIHGAGGKVFATISGNKTALSTENRLAMSQVDIPVFFVEPKDRTAATVGAVGPLSLSKKVFKYGDPFPGSGYAERDRYYFGLHLLANGYSGAMNYVYQDSSARGDSYTNIDGKLHKYPDGKQHYAADAWNDFYWYPNVIDNAIKKPGSNHMYTYPTTDGPIDTIEWEAHREGIDDIRYVSTLAARKAWIKPQAECYASALVSKYNRGWWVNAADSGTARQQVIHDIIAAEGTRVSSVSSANLVGHWRFDEPSGVTAKNSAAVVSASSIDGALLDGPAWAESGAGRLAGALRFDGLNDRVQVSDKATLKWKLGDLTFSVWMFADQTENDGGTLLSKPFDGHGHFNYQVLYNADATITVVLMGGNGGSDINTAPYSLTSSRAVTQGGWHHIVVTLTAADKSVNIYVDGVLNTRGTYQLDTADPVARSDDEGSVMDNNLPLVFGYVYPYSSTPRSNSVYGFDGMLDDIRIYTRVLSENEIAGLFDSYELLLCAAGAGSGKITSTMNTMGNTTCDPHCASSYGRGAEVTLSAEPDLNSVFEAWSGCGVSGNTGRTCTVTMDSLHVVIANFIPKPTDAEVGKRFDFGATGNERH